MTWTGDLLDRLTKMTDNAAETAIDYDAMGRKVRMPGSGTAQYQYDAFGTMLGNTHRIQTAGPFSFTYAEDGNLCIKSSNGAAVHFQWDERDTLAFVTNAHTGDGGGNWVRFQYDATGQRLRKWSSLGNDFRYINGYYAEKHYAGDTLRITNTHIYAGTERVCTVVNGNPHFIHRDQINSAGLITSTNSGEVSRVAFAPYGTVVYQSGSGSTNGIEEKFTGQILDKETGLYYYNARYYDPQIGVFISPDSIVPDPFDSQSLNRYMYVRGNPMKYTDPSGHVAFTIGAILFTIAVLDNTVLDHKIEKLLDKACQKLHLNVDVQGSGSTSFGSGGGSGGGGGDGTGAGYSGGGLDASLQKIREDYWAAGNNVDLGLSAEEKRKAGREVARQFKLSMQTDGNNTAVGWINGCAILIRAGDWEDARNPPSNKTLIGMLDMVKPEVWYFLSKLVQANNLEQLGVTCLFRPNAEPHTSGYAVDLGYAIEKNGKRVDFIRPSASGEPGLAYGISLWARESGLVSQVIGPWRNWGYFTGDWRINLLRNYGRYEMPEWVHRHHIHFTVRAY